MNGAVSNNKRYFVSNSLLNRRNSYKQKEESTVIISAVIRAYIRDNGSGWHMYDVNS